MRLTCKLIFDFGSANHWSGAIVRVTLSKRHSIMQTSLNIGFRLSFKQVCRNFYQEAVTKKDGQRSSYDYDETESSHVGLNQHDTEEKETEKTKNHEFS